MDYVARRERIKEHQREQVRSVQEIGAIPPVSNPDRRRRASGDGGFPFFCETYFPAAFTLPWSRYHLSAAAKIERAASQGGLFAFAMPRGSGKTTICEWAVLWSILTGRASYVLLVGATEKASESRLRNIKVELQSNVLLAEDWPEVCFPIERLERSAARCNGQKHNGVNTAMVWKNKELVLPTVNLEPGEAYLPADGKPETAPTSGSVMGVSGITGEIRGLNHKRESGEIVRPQLAICDDPQTRESAKSRTQSADRAATIAGDVAYLGGPGQPPIAVVMPCTVVYQDDMADRLLDRELYPEWQGERTRMVETFPEGLMEGKQQSETCRKWAEYREIRENSFRNDGDGGEATAFYRENQAVMDEGFSVSWPERFSQGEVSAIQHAMNCYFRDPASFFSEYQNEPINAAEETPELSDDEIAGKVSGLPRGRIPAGADTVTAFIDVGKDTLWWLVAAWEDKFSGQVVDYGAFPEVPARGGAPRKRLADMAAGHGMEGALFAGLTATIAAIAGRKYRREDGADMPIARLLIDANWGQSTPVVYRVCRDSPFSGILAPAHGKFVGASSTPWSEYKPKRGEKIGHHWRLGPSATNPGIRRVLTDTNYWKSFVYDRLATAAGDNGSLVLFQDAVGHSRFAEHINAEYRVSVEAKTSGRVVDEWKQRPERPDNHWLDCLVGAAVAASIEGISLAGVLQEGQATVAKRRYKSLSELRQEKKRGR